MNAPAPLTLPASLVVDAARIPGPSDIVTYVEGILARHALVGDLAAIEPHARRLEVMQARCMARQAGLSVGAWVRREEGLTDPTSAKAKGGPRWVIRADLWLERLTAAPLSGRYFWTGPGSAKAEALGKLGLMRGVPDLPDDAVALTSDSPTWRIGQEFASRSAWFCARSHAEGTACSPTATAEHLSHAYAEAEHWRATYEYHRARRMCARP